VQYGRAASRFQSLQLMMTSSTTSCCSSSMLLLMMVLVGARQRRRRPHRGRVRPLTAPGGAGGRGRRVAIRLEEEAELRVAAAALEVAQRRRRDGSAAFLVVRRQLLEQHCADNRQPTPHVSVSQLFVFVRFCFVFPLIFPFCFSAVDYVD